MAAIAVPEPLQKYIPRNIHPSQVWVQYDQHSDSLVVYVTGKPVPTVWNDIDDYAYLGFALDDEEKMTGIMIEHFSQWLLVPDRDDRVLESV